jgi:hypothetical protein
MHETIAREAQNESVRVGGIRFDEEVGGPLQQAPARSQGAKVLLESRSGVALGVRDDRPRATRGKPVDERWQLVPDRAWRGLEKHPATAVERDLTQLRCAESVGGEMGDLSPLGDPHAHSVLIELALKPGDQCRELLYAYVVVVADVRRGTDDLYPVVLSFARHREGRENVGVKIDHLATTLRGLTEVCSRCGSPLLGEH